MWILFTDTRQDATNYKAHGSDGGGITLQTENYGSIYFVIQIPPFIDLGRGA